MSWFQRIKATVADLTQPIGQPTNPWEEELFRDSGRSSPTPKPQGEDRKTKSQVHSGLSRLGVPDRYLQPHEGHVDLEALRLAQLSETLRVETTQALNQGLKLPKESKPAAGKRYNRRLPCPELLDVLVSRGPFANGDRQRRIGEMLADPALLVAVAGWIGVPSFALEAHLRAEFRPEEVTAPTGRLGRTLKADEKEALDKRTQEERALMITWVREFRAILERPELQKFLLDAGGTDEQARTFYRLYQRLVAIPDARLHEYATWPFGASHLLHGDRDPSAVEIRLALAVEAPDLAAIRALLPVPGQKIPSPATFVSAVIERALYAPEGSPLRAQLLGMLEDAVAAGQLSREAVHNGVARKSTTWLLRHQPMGILTLAPGAVSALEELAKAKTREEEDAAVVKAAEALAPWTHPGSIATLLLSDGSAQGVLPQVQAFLSRLAEARGQREFELTPPERLLPSVIEKGLADGQLGLPVDGPTLLGLAEAVGRRLISHQALRAARDQAPADAVQYARKKVGNVELRAFLAGKKKPAMKAAAAAPSASDVYLLQLVRPGPSGKATAQSSVLLEALARQQPNNPTTAPSGGVEHLYEKESV